jgi:polyhydroxyalkanoate synthesis regulator phasin
MAAISATVALFRALVKKGVLSRDEAVRAILDEAVTRAIQAEAEAQGQVGRTPNEVNRQAAEILKFIGEKL